MPVHFSNHILIMCSWKAPQINVKWLIAHLNATETKSKQQPGPERNDLTRLWATGNQNRNTNPAQTVHFHDCTCRRRISTQASSLHHYEPLHQNPQIQLLNCEDHRHGGNTDCRPPQTPQRHNKLARHDESILCKLFIYIFFFQDGDHTPRPPH